jgi:hypothetical protein
MRGRLFQIAAAASLTLSVTAEAQPRQPAPNAAYLIGHWTDNPERCTGLIEFRRDGRFVLADGGGGNWRLERGGLLTLSGAGGAQTLRLERIGPHQVRVRNPDGSVGGSYRCNAGAQAWQAPLSRR